MATTKVTARLKDKFDKEIAPALAKELGMRPLEANCHRGLANLFDLGKQKSHAERHRDIANSLVHTMKMRFWG